MLSKLALILLLSKYATLADLGVYGLFVSSIVILNYLQGVEFNRYTARELDLRDRSRVTQIVVNQLIVHLVCYGVVLPLSLAVFFVGFLPWEFAPFFIWIAIFSHLGQEINRLLIIFGKVSKAYWVSFVTHGLWACIITIAFYFNPKILAVSSILLVWSISTFLGVLIGVWFLRQSGCFKPAELSVDADWIKRGLLVSSRFFFSVLAFKVIELSDRYFIQYFYGDALVGVYTFYGSVASVVQEFVYTGVVVSLVPSLFSLSKNEDSVGVERTLYKMRRRIWFSSIIIVLFVLILMIFLLRVIDRDLMSDHYISFIVLVFGCVVVNISQVPHFRLYLNGQELQLMWSAIAGVILNLALNTLLIPDYGTLGAATATVAALLSVLAINMWNLSKSLNRGTS